MYHLVWTQLKLNCSELHVTANKVRNDRVNFKIIVVRPYECPITLLNVRLHCHCSLKAKGRKASDYVPLTCFHGVKPFRDYMACYLPFVMDFIRMKCSDTIIYFNIYKYINKYILVNIFLRRNYKVFDNS